MAVNNLGFEQAAAILQAVARQTTGQDAISVTNLQDFVSIANTTLQTGYDPLATAISQVLSKTIFSVRPYYAKLTGMMVDEVTYGNHVRKLNMIDPDIEDDDRLNAGGNFSIDMYQAQQMKAIQTNFYGANQYQRGYKVYRDQLDSAFTGPEQFGNFISAWIQNATDSLEKYREQFARISLMNITGAVAAGHGGTGSVVHVLTEYQQATGNNTITASNYLGSAEFGDFAKWLYAFLNNRIKFMSERTTLYHAGFTAGDIMRHTPRREMRVYMINELMEMIKTSVMSAAFNEQMLTIGDYDTINYWQNIQDPTSLMVAGNYMAADGSVATFNYDSTAEGAAPIIGVLMDREAAGVTLVNQWSATTPFNARGGYFVDWYHETCRWWNDLSENCVVLLLD